MGPTSRACVAVVAAMIISTSGTLNLIAATATWSSQPSHLIDGSLATSKKIDHPASAVRAVELLDDDGRVIDLSKPEKLPIRKSPPKAKTQPALQEPQSSNEPKKSLEEIIKNLASTKIKARLATEGTKERLRDVAESKSAEEFHSRVRRLPVEIEVVPASDGRDGTFKNYIVGGKTRVRLFTPSNFRPQQTQNLLVRNYDVESNAQPNDTFVPPLVSGTRDGECYWEGVQGDCPTEQELEDQIILVANMEAEEAQAQADLDALNQEYYDYCAQYGCDNFEESLTPASGPSADSERCAIPGCAGSAIAIGAAVVGHVASRVALAAAINGHLAGTVLVSTAGWWALGLGAAAATLWVVSSVVSYVECVQSLPRVAGIPFDPAY